MPREQDQAAATRTQLELEPAACSGSVLALPAHQLDRGAAGEHGGERRGAGTQMHRQAVLLPALPTWLLLPLGSQKLLVTALLWQDAASKDRKAAKRRAGLKARGRSGPRARFLE